MNDIVTAAIKNLEEHFGWGAQISLLKRWQSSRGDVCIGFSAAVVSKSRLSLGAGRTIEEAVASCVADAGEQEGLSWPKNYDPNDVGG